MKRLIPRTVMVRTAFVVFLMFTKSHAQSGVVIPQADADQASPASCVILKRMGRIDRAKSRLPSLGITGKQFRYVEGKLPEGISPHHKMTDHDVRNLQAHGAQVLVLDSHYTSEDLKEARANCPRQTAKPANQIEAKASPAPAPALIASTSPAAKALTAKPPDAKAPAPKAEDSASSAKTTEPSAGAPAAKPKPLTAKASTPKADDSASSTRITETPAGTPTPAPKPPTAKARTPEAHDLASSTDATVAALVDVSSTPAGADVYIDEQFFGRTPAPTIILMPGNHKIAVRKDGFVVWKSKFNLPSGHTNVDAALVPKAK